MRNVKVCLLGASAVGKTSLVRRFVHGMFDERYLTTVGVKIDKRAVEVGGEQVSLIVWDLSGEDEFAQLQMSYLRGAAGYLLVADGLRPATLAKVIELEQRVRAEQGERPFVLALNKADQAGQWQLDQAEIQSLEDKGWTILRTSALSGDGVEDAFARLSRATVSNL